MKKYILLLAIISMFSCNKILNQEPIGSRTDVDYWQTEADMVDAQTALSAREQDLNVRERRITAKERQHKSSLRQQLT